jgi:hypothetical protein
MRTLIALALSLLFTINARALPPEEMQEIIELLRMHAEVSSGDFKTRVNGEFGSMGLHYQKTKSGVRLTFLY